MKAILPLLMLLGLTVSTAAQAQKLTIIREFPGSTPPHLMIEVEASGKGVYKEGADSEWPIKFALTQPEVKELFDLAAKCDYFKRELESGLKVAFMGTKTFRWEQGGTKTEIKFNYTQDEQGKLLQDWFEKIAETEQHYLRLERSVKYDKLGVNQALLYLAAADDKKRVVSLEQFLPLLDRVQKNDAYLHMARERAAQLYDAFKTRLAGPAAPTEGQPPAAAPAKGNQ
jgi:hypothetical protein